MRLVNIRGKKYVALTDLSKFGDTQTKTFAYLKGFGVKSAEIERVREFTQAVNKKAESEGRSLYDAWGYVVDIKSGKVHAFILDLGFYSDRKTRRMDGRK